MKLLDYTNLNSSNLPNFSSNWNETSNTGTFQLQVNNSTTNSNSNIDSHSMFSIIKIRFHYLGSCQNKITESCVSTKWKTWRVKH